MRSSFADAEELTFRYGTKHVLGKTADPLYCIYSRSGSTFVSRGRAYRRMYSGVFGAAKEGSILIAAVESGDLVGMMDKIKEVDVPTAERTGCCLWLRNSCWV